MAVISQSQVEHVAALARLRFDQQARERMAGDLNEILQYVNQLAGLDTDGVPPTTQALDPQDNVLRPDCCRPGLTRDEALADAPAAAAGMVQVPRVVGVP